MNLADDNYWQLKFKIIGESANNAPALILIIYCISRILDNYTTFLATPDLSYEGNWFIRRLDLSWAQIILKDVFIVLFAIISYLIAIGTIDIFYRGIKGNDKISTIKLARSTKIVLSFIVFCFFYSHLSYSLFLILNNYLHYIYIYEIQNLFSPVSGWYVTEIIMVVPNIFTYYHLFLILVGTIISIFFMKNYYYKTTKWESL